MSFLRSNRVIFMVISLAAVISSCGGDPDRSSAQGNWICFTFSSGDWQSLADVEGEFIVDGQLIEGVRGYHSTSSPARLSIELDDSVSAEEFLVANKSSLDKYGFIEDIEILSSDCA